MNEVLKAEVPTYTYNSAGLHPNIIKELDLDIENKRYITAFYTNKDQLSFVQDNRKSVAQSVMSISKVSLPSYAFLEASSTVAFDQSMTKVLYGTLNGDNIPPAIGNPVLLHTHSGHTILATKEIEEEIRKYYAN